MAATTFDSPADFENDCGKESEGGVGFENGFGPLELMTCKICFHCTYLTLLLSSSFLHVVLILNQQLDSSHCLLIAEDSTYSNLGTPRPNLSSPLAL